MPAIGNTVVVGEVEVKALVNATQQRLAGLQNALSVSTLLSFLNEGKDEVWAILKELKDDYFVGFSQSTLATQSNYFPVLDITKREFTLPPDFQSIKWIEVLGPSGYETTRFEYRDAAHPEFREVRMTNSIGSGSYLYDIIGRNTLVLAQFPEIAFQLQLWYASTLPDFDINGSLSNMAAPYSKKIVDYAVKKSLLVLQDDEDFEEWKNEWKMSVITLSSAAPRNGSDPQYVQDFVG